MILPFKQIPDALLMIGPQYRLSYEDGEFVFRQMTEGWTVIKRDGAK